MSAPIIVVDEEWCSIDLESKLNKKIDALQSLVHQQSQQIQELLTEVRRLQDELHQGKSKTHSQNDRTHQLLEELKVLKERELNLALREKKPVPFHPPPLFFSLHDQLKSPLFKGSKGAKLPPFHL